MLRLIFGTLGLKTVLLPEVVNFQIPNLLKYDKNYEV